MTWPGVPPSSARPLSTIFELVMGSPSAPPHHMALGDCFQLSTAWTRSKGCPQVESIHSHVLYFRSSRDRLHDSMAGCDSWVIIRTLKSCPWTASIFTTLQCLAG